MSHSTDRSPEIGLHCISYNTNPAHTGPHPALPQRTQLPSENMALSPESSPKSPCVPWIVTQSLGIHPSPFSQALKEAVFSSEDEAFLLEGLDERDVAEKEQAAQATKSAQLEAAVASAVESAVAASVATAKQGY